MDTALYKNLPFTFTTDKHKLPVGGMHSIHFQYTIIETNSTFYGYTLRVQRTLKQRACGMDWHWLGN